jgi:hypothetical protein
MNTLSHFSSSSIIIPFRTLGAAARDVRQHVQFVNVTATGDDHGTCRDVQRSSDTDDARGRGQGNRWADAWIAWLWLRSKS